MVLALNLLTQVNPCKDLAVKSGWRQKIEDTMATNMEKPRASRQFDRITRNLAVGGVIVSGAILWGYAVYHVAMRTL